MGKNEFNGLQDGSFLGMFLLHCYFLLSNRPENGRVGLMVIVDGFVDGLVDSRTD